MTILQAGTIGGTLLNVDATGLALAGAVTLDAASVLNVSVGYVGIANANSTTGASLTLQGLAYATAADTSLGFSVPVHNAGTFVIDNGQFVSVGSIDGNGTVELGVGTLSVFSGIAASQSLRFISNSATLVLTGYNPGVLAPPMAAPISNFGPGDFIDLGGLRPDALSFSNGTLTISKAGTTLGTLTFVGAYATGDFQLATDTMFRTAITTTAVASVPSPATLPSLSGTVAIVPQQGSPFAGLAIADAGIDSLAVSVVRNTGSLSATSPGGATGAIGDYGAVGTAASLTALLRSVIDVPAATAPAVNALATRIAVTNPNGTAFDEATAFILRQYGAAATVPAASISIAVAPDGASVPAPAAGQINEAFVASPPAGGSAFLPSGYQAIYLGFVGDATLVDPGVGGAVLAGNASNDLIYALGTNDILVAGSGSDTMVATGASTILAGAVTGNAVVFGGSGATSITGPSTYNAHATIVAGSGDTTITSGGVNGVPNTALIALGAGNDVVTLGGTETIFAGSGASSISVSGYGSFVALGAGPAVVRDTLFSRNSILGGSGSATVTLSGNDVMFGGSGTSQITTTPRSGGHTFVGGTGSATIVGGGALLGGSDGNNAITIDSYDPGSEAFGAGNGDVIASFASDLPVQQATNLVAGAGNETLVAAQGSSNTAMFAGPGTDAIMAFGARQTVYGATGAAAIAEGSGSTVLVLLSAKAGGTDSVTGFDPSRDLILFAGYAPGTGAAALASATVANGSETLSLNDGTRVTLLGFTGLSSANLIG